MDIETSADEQQTVRIVIKTINNETHEFHVPRDFPVTSLKERVRVNTSNIK
jgi:hypothetical protein